MDYLINAYIIVTTVVTLASIIANVTDTPRDDAWVKTAYTWLERFAFLNYKAKQP